MTAWTNDGPDPLAEAMSLLTVPEVADKLGFPGLKVGLQKSPFREDAKPSFSVFKGGRMWKDQATGETGGVWGFAALALGTTDKRAIADAIKHCAGIADDPEWKNRKPRPQAPPPKQAMFEHSPAWPLHVMDRFKAGVAELGADAALMARVAAKRGWPVSFVERLVEAEMLGYPPLPWCDEKAAGTGARFQRGLAFRVDAPAVRNGLVCPLGVGYHQMFRVEDRRQWVYVPYAPQKPRSVFQEDLARRGDAIHPYPFLIGDANADAWVITEGQWDAATFALAAGQAFSGVAMGLRGNHTVELFFACFQEVLARVRPVVWLVPDNDEAGKRWLERDAKSPDKASFVERLSMAGARAVWVSDIRAELGKDFNDLFRARLITAESMRAWAVSLGLDGVFFRGPEPVPAADSVERKAVAL